MHDAVVVVWHIQRIHFPDRIPLKVVQGTRFDVIPLNPDVLVSICSWLFMEEANGMAKLMNDHTHMVMAWLVRHSKGEVLFAPLSSNIGPTPLEGQVKREIASVKHFIHYRSISIQTCSYITCQRTSSSVQKECSLHHCPVLGQNEGMCGSSSAAFPFQLSPSPSHLQQKSHGYNISYVVSILSKWNLLKWLYNYTVCLFHTGAVDTDPLHGMTFQHGLP